MRKIIFIAYSYRWLRQKIAPVDDVQQSYFASKELSDDPIRQQLLGFHSSSGYESKDLPLKQWLAAAH